MPERGDFGPIDTPLPGLDSPRDVEVTQGEVERAARRTLDDLHKAGHVTAQHAVLMSTLLTVARQLDRASTSQKAKDYGVAALAAQLRETYIALAPKDEGGESDPFAEFAAELAAEQGGGPALRDPS